jgi:protein subunit release factor A
MIEQLTSIETKYLDLRAQMLDEAVYSDLKKSRELNKQLSDLEDAYDIAVAYKKAYGELQEANEILSAESDPDFWIWQKSNSSLHKRESLH